MHKRIIWLCLLLIVASSPVWAVEFSGTVIGIHDGDTITVLTPDRRQVRVRLAEVDAPESDQPYGERAKEVLTALIFGDRVNVVIQAQDDYERIVGRVYMGSMDVSAELVKRGAAWVYRPYVRDQTLFTLEAEARASKRGLWILPRDQRIPPWEWRHQSTATATAPTATAVERTCAAKRSCRDMTSCEEAMFYLKHCGFRHLDRDGDGVPCEALCR